ncbi:MAG: BNR-4 repeat-containing protein [Cyclobacteriaceae bacterium]
MNLRFLALVFCFFGMVLLSKLSAQDSVNRNNQSVEGYKGIWFTLNQFSAYGDKYSGGLGTYTAHHIPMAIYAPAVHKTFFVYGGTTHPKEKYLLCMIGSFDHANNTVSRPVIVHDKGGVDDPHDNPSLLLDQQGYLWVFVSGRNTRRMGYKYKSSQPYDISSFKQITEEVMTYPQPWFIKDQGYFHFFTKYTGVRELYFETSQDGITWTDDRKLAGIKKPTYAKSGHYQVSNQTGNKIVTFFNWHPNGNVDKRTNVYYVQTLDFGKTFETADGKKLALPIEEIASPARIMDYEALQTNVYLCDVDFDQEGNPVCLYVTSKGHEPGPQNGTREWHILNYDGKEWQDRIVCKSDHNYDMGSLFMSGNTWRIVAPTDNGPQVHGSGGEVVMWESIDCGLTWSRFKQLTAKSERNHNYIRRVVNGKSPFLYFWADGDPNTFSPSYLYMGDEKGLVWQFPYLMEGEEQKLEKVDVK